MPNELPLMQLLDLHHCILKDSSVMIFVPDEAVDYRRPTTLVCAATSRSRASGAECHSRVFGRIRNDEGCVFLVTQSISFERGMIH